MPHAPPALVPLTPVLIVDKNVSTITPPALHNPIILENSALVPSVPSPGPAPVPRGHSVERRPRQPNLAVEIGEVTKSRSWSKARSVSFATTTGYPSAEPSGDPILLPTKENAERLQRK